MKKSYVNLHMNSYVLYSGSWNQEKKGLGRGWVDTRREKTLKIILPETMCAGSVSQLTSTGLLREALLTFVGAAKLMFPFPFGK